jgi:hypothetical protein
MNGNLLVSLSSAWHFSENWPFDRAGDILLFLVIVFAIVLGSVAWQQWTSRKIVLEAQDDIMQEYLWLNDSSEDVDVVPETTQQILDLGTRVAKIGGLTSGSKVNWVQQADCLDDIGKEMSRLTKAVQNEIRLAQKAREACRHQPLPE